MSSIVHQVLSRRAARFGVSVERNGGDESKTGEGAPAFWVEAAIDLVPSSLSHFELAERLVQVWLRNRRNLNRLEELEVRIGVADRRLASSRPGRRVVEAHRERLLAQRWEILGRLRADARLAEALVNEFEARGGPRGDVALAPTA